MQSLANQLDEGGGNAKAECCKKQKDSPLGITRQGGKTAFNVLHEKFWHSGLVAQIVKDYWLWDIPGSGFKGGGGGHPIDDSPFEAVIAPRKIVFEAAWPDRRAKRKRPEVFKSSGA
jgi:hypothetical protein